MAKKTKGEMMAISVRKTQTKTKIYLASIAMLPLVGFLCGSCDGIAYLSVAGLLFLSFPTCLHAVFIFSLFLFHERRIKKYRINNLSIWLAYISGFIFLCFTSIDLGIQVRRGGSGSQFLPVALYYIPYYCSAIFVSVYFFGWLIEVFINKMKPLKG